MQAKNFQKPDEQHDMSNAKMSGLKVGDKNVYQMVYQPGWKWSKDMSPVVGTATCQMHHVLYAISGEMKVVLDDGSETIMKAGDFLDLPAGHDAEVVGDEPFVAFDLAGLQS
ncbi:MAG TPA: cupin domain-containing protein [Candidatus Saccharimonadales bacterium]|nr:cupin domain-containing protein [Candidatus Saccharimonadales bacterium]